MSRWIPVTITKCFDDTLVPGEEVEVEFQGQVFPGTHDTRESPGDSPELSVDKTYLVVNGKTTDKEVTIPDDLYEKVYDDLLERALDTIRDDDGPEYEPDNEREDRYEPEDYDTDYFDPTEEG